MQKKVLVAGAVIVVVIAGATVTLLSQDILPDTGVAPSIVEPQHLPVSNIMSGAGDDTSLAKGGQALILARTELEVATEEYAAAEREYNALESELVEAENYVDGLEALGEDPAKHAEEGMLLLRPIIEKYEVKLRELEVKEARLEIARENYAEVIGTSEK